MNIQKLIESKLINKAELAREMWPEIKDAPGRLNNKLKNNIGQRITESDEKKIETIFKKLLTDII